MTGYVFHDFINSDDSNTVLMVFGNFWDGTATGGGGTDGAAMYYYLMNQG